MIRILSNLVLRSLPLVHINGLSVRGQGAASLAQVSRPERLREEVRNVLGTGADQVLGVFHVKRETK